MNEKNSTVQTYNRTQSLDEAIATIYSELPTEGRVELLEIASSIAANYGLVLSPDTKA